MAVTQLEASDPSEHIEAHAATYQADLDEMFVGWLVKPKPYQPNCDAPKDREEADLCAQGRMAKAAEELVTLTDRQIWIGAFGLAALVATILVSIKATRTARDSVNAATDSNRLSRESFITEQRPWVSIKPRIVADLVYNPKGGSFSASFKLSNVGKSPANVWLNVEVYCLGHQATPPVLDGLRIFCKSHRVLRADKPGDTLFPGDSFTRLFHLLIKQEEIEVLPDLGETKMVVPVVFACATYKSELTGQVHQTGQTFILFQSGSRGGSAVLPSQGTVKQSQLGFDIFPGASIAT